MGALLRYHGSKVRMAPALISLMPNRPTYVEPFGGGAGVLLARPRTRLEVYNDLDRAMVTFFRVLRDRPDDLARVISATPFARDEFAKAREIDVEDELEVARRVLIRSHGGHGSNGVYASTGFRAAGMRAGSLPCHLWRDLPHVVLHTAERMQGVVIENRPAIQVIRDNDGPETLHYVDPPYVHATRGKHTDAYRHEMSDPDHAELLDALCDLKGAVVLSGYSSPLYDEALTGWRRAEIRVRADKALERTEVIWMNFEDEVGLLQALSRKSIS